MENREAVMEKNRNRYRALPPEEKKQRYESNRQWYNRQSPEKKSKNETKGKRILQKVDIISWW